MGLAEDAQRVIRARATADDAARESQAASEVVVAELLAEFLLEMNKLGNPGLEKAMRYVRRPNGASLATFDGPMCWTIYTRSSELANGSPFMFDPDGTFWSTAPKRIGHGLKWVPAATPGVPSTFVNDVGQFKSELVRLLAQASA